MQSVISKDAEPKAPDNLILVPLLIYRPPKSGYISISHEANVTLASSDPIYGSCAIADHRIIYTEYFEIILRTAISEMVFPMHVHLFVAL